MHLTEFVIRRKVFIAMLFIGLSLLGYISYRNLSLELMPNVESPYLTVQVNASREMNPRYIERKALIPLEGAVGTLEGVSSIESTINQRRGSISVYFNQNVNIKYAGLQLQQKVSNVAAEIGDEFTVNVSEVNTESVSNTFMLLEVRGSGGLDRVRSVIDKSITPELENIDGIATVQVSGGTQKSMEIVLDNDAAEAHRVTPSRVRQLISQNTQQKVFLGPVYENRRRYSANLVAEYTDVNELENIVVDPAGPILLKDISTITFGELEQTTISRVNGMEAITIVLVRDAAVNLIDLSHEARAVVDQLNRDLAYQDVQIVIQTDMAEEMENNINMIKQLAVLGGILAMLILWMFLNNLRLVLVVVLAMPASILIAFNLFYFFDITLNSLTLVGLAMAVGMLLNNSVVVLENIYRHRALGRDAETSVITGSKEVWRSIWAATLTTATVFLPFIFSSDYLIRVIGKQIGVSIVSTLFVSLAAALLLIPMLVHLLLRKDTGVVESFARVSQKNRLVQIYTTLLKFTIRYPGATIVGAVVTFFISLTLAVSLSMDVPTEVELSEFNLYLTASSGATLEQTDSVTRELEKLIVDIPEIQDIVTTVYEGEASLTVVLKDDFEEINDRTITMIREDIDDRVDDFRLAQVSLSEPTSSSSRFSGGGGGGMNPADTLNRMFGVGTQQESIILRGPDFDLLTNVAEDIEYYLGELESVSRTDVSIPRQSPEIHILFDNRLMNDNDLTVNAVSSELATFQPEVSSGMTYTQGLDEYEIMIRNAEEEEEKSFDDLKSLMITNTENAPVALSEVSRIVYGYGESGINRIDQEKQVEITYSFESDVTDSKTLLQTSRDEVDALIAGISIPSGIAVEAVHTQETTSEFVILIAAAFILIYMILAAVFESLLTPAVMMFTIPLATVGSFWALIITGNSITNANALMGLLILLGVVVNNGIILLDYTRILRQSGATRVRALMTAGQARVRPILITAITTMVAMFPLAMGNAEYISRIGAPFAITVIGGLAMGTMFTLLFIPSVYMAMETAVDWFRSLSIRWKIFQGLAVAIVCFIVYRSVDSALWQSAYYFLAVVGIPWFTWFMMSSLRHSQADYVPQGAPLNIGIHRLVKIYDEPGRFMREWRKGQRVKERWAKDDHPESLRNFNVLVWQLPLLAFLVYFIYFYIYSQFWIFFMTHVLYAYVIYMIKPLGAFLRARADMSGKGRRALTVRAFGGAAAAFVWGFPLLNLAIFHQYDFPVPVIAFIAIIWYGALIVYTTSNYLHRTGINIMRLKGKFANLRRKYFQMVTMIPVIGRKKRPFNALDGVTLDIENGMFGLLGPNGAGKTTLMRVVCGILNQSMGTVKINGIDFTEKREELQGLIGYLPQEFGTYENMTAYEFLDYIAILKGIHDRKKRADIVNYVLTSVHLGENKNRRIGSFSGGMKQRVGIAMTLLHLPRILVVDEPTAGLDPRERIRFRNLLVELSRDRIVIFSTHIIEDVSSSCKRLAVLQKGSLYYIGDPQQMTQKVRGHVWQFSVTPEEFERLKDQLRIVHHMQIDKKTRVRCLSQDQPHPDAEQVHPTLEDAYLWLLGKRV